MRTRPGQGSPLGAHWDGLGVGFALYAERAEAVTLLLFDSPQDRSPRAEIPVEEHSGPIWHVYLPGLRPGQLYGFRVDGPYAPEEGVRFNRNKVLLDPYAKAIGRPLRWHDSLFGYQLGAESGDLSFSTHDDAPYAPLGKVVDPSFAWGDDRRPEIPWEKTIIYETHVRGATMRHPDVPLALRGTYLGLASEPFIDHLLSLGITTVELLPIQAFVQDRVLVERGLRNYWGYSPLAYFAPEPSYAAGGVETAVHEVKTMVRAFHAAGLEVLIDVVYNHTGEGSELGPTLCYRGIDSLGYYKRSEAAPRYTKDYTGTGNTLDPANTFVIQLITDSLRYWVEEMHVDGFRFDLASTLGRDEEEVDLRGGFFKAIQQDPLLSRVKLIAEPWDVGPGGYRVGGFPWPWREWNGRYRDAARRYWRGDPWQRGELATRIVGSSDLYERRAPGAGRKRLRRSRRGPLRVYHRAMSTRPPESTREVSARHRFDTEPLREWLDAKVGRTRGPLTVRQFRGGQSNPTFWLSDGSSEWVLRKKPPGKLLPSAHQIEREYRVLAALAQTDVPVARVFGLCEDPTLIGTPFYVMEHVEGRIFWNVRLSELEPAQRSAIYDELARVLATIHSVDVDAIGLGDYGKRGRYVERQIKRWTDQYRKSETERIATMDALIEYLPAHLPAHDETTLVHGDFRLDNLIFHPSEPRVLAVIDWELSTLGHPLADLAYTSMLYDITMPRIGGLLGVDFDASGIPSESAFVARYQTLTGRRNIGDFPYFKAFSLFRLAAIAQGVYARSLQGNASSDDASMFGAAVGHLSAVACELVGIEAAPRSTSSER